MTTLSRPILTSLMAGLAIALSGCDTPNTSLDSSADAQGHSAPTAATAAHNEQIAKQLPFADRQDFADAERGLIASEDNLLISDKEGNIVWNQNAYKFITGKAPASVHPSLWRQAKLNNKHGLFKVADGLYQIRGYDLSNMTIIEGNSGLILVDPLTTIETAERALTFTRKHLGEKPVTGIIFTHSHVDHFGGALGVISEQDAKSGNIPIIAPSGFMEESTSENILAGPTMARRAGFMYGRDLAISERGHIDTGLGKAPAFGTISIVAPNTLIDSTPQTLTVDGVEIIFQNTPGAEAPAELTFYLPKQKAFCGAEILSRNMHNLYTLRGAKVRDALAWSNYIEESRHLFADAEIYFASHHWPMWGKDNIDNFLKLHRDTYKYIHDQTLRLAHQGYTPREIADTIEMPESLNNSFSNRGYYGTLRHNSRAVYQGYFGWYDGNPANLNPLTPTESGKRYVEAMGGAEKMLMTAQQAYEKGEYRWVAELLNHLVFADVSNHDAKQLLAQAYDQLGYQSESGPWRDVYLSAAYELRHGKPAEGLDLSTARGMIKHAPLENFFQVMAAQINGPKADGLKLTINFTFTDLNETHVLQLENGVLHHRKQQPKADADITLNITHDLFLDIALGTADMKKTLFSDQLSIEGSKLDLVRFFSLMEKQTEPFDIVLRP
jgi:alkyl sulfatase BDS1-like metallo-beta-lactamase superfamily hydrolase